MLISYWSSDVCSSDLYPALRLGPPWWFHDSPEGMWRYRRQVTETAGFYNTVGFNDDTRAFPSIPARHDVARRLDCAYLARSEEHTSALQSLMRISYAVFCLTKKRTITPQ